MNHLRTYSESYADVVNAPAFKTEGSVREDDGVEDWISSVSIGVNYVCVWVKMRPVCWKPRMEFLWSPNTRLSIGGRSLPLVGHWQSADGLYLSVDPDGCSHRGWDSVNRDEIRSYNIIFRGHVDGEPTRLRISDSPWGRYGNHGGSLETAIIKPDTMETYPKLTEEALKKWAVDEGGLCGIYQTIGDTSWKLGCFKDTSGKWVLVHFDNGNHPWRKNNDATNCRHVCEEEYCRPTNNLRVLRLYVKDGIGMNRWMMVAIVCAALAVVALVALGIVWSKWHDCRFELELLQVQLSAEKLD